MLDAAARADRRPSGVDHLKRCHLANPELIYRTEVLPEIAPDLVEEIR